MTALDHDTFRINPDLALTARQILDTPGSLRTVPTPVEGRLPQVVT